ncbi:MAG TPA: SsrA-binding protein SmpB [Clostridia bacterium]|nr:SsrA-binding protein SmpB [Clostridia bacterium]
MPNDSVKTIATNKKALHDYFIEESYEAGIVLSGTEVKSIRQGKLNFKDSYATVVGGEVILYNLHISPYEKGNIFNKDPMRDRKLLLNAREIRKLASYVQKDGYTLVPLKVYLKGQLVKVALGVGKGKKLYDKRDSEARRDAERDMKRAIREKNKI